MPINDAAPSRSTEKTYRETGFPEPLSEDRNTTLPHSGAQIAPQDELDMAQIEKRHHHRRRHLLGHHHKSVEDVEREMYQGLEYADEGEKEERGAVKKVLGKLRLVKKN